MLVWTPDDPERRTIDELPGVTTAPLPPDAGGSPDLEQVEAVLVADDLPPLADMPALRLVQGLGAGVDGIAGRVPAGVPLCSARGVHDGPVAEWVVGALLADTKQLAAHRDAQHREAWGAAGRARELAGDRVLILGHGSIGAAVEARLTPFGVQIVRVARRRRAGVHAVGDLPALLPAADAVVLLAPLTDETRGMVDASFLARMRDGALVVNAARGPLVDQRALVRELQQGRLRAVLDVTDPEPLPPGDPLWGLPGVLITPHVAGAADEWRERVYAFARGQIERLLAGRPLLNVVRAGY